MTPYDRDVPISWRKDTNNPLTSMDMNDLLVKMEGEPAAVKSIFYAANVLTCLSHGVYNITEIARICQINKATVHRILKAMVDSNLAIQDPIKRQYYLGHSISRIVANPYTTHEHLITCGFQAMSHLSDVTGETVFINILLGIQYINLREIPARFDLRVAEVTRKTGHVPAGASSKVLLSQLTDDELKNAMQFMDLKYPTGQMVTEKTLQAEVFKTRRAGYCISYGERISGCICISAPVLNYVQPAAVSIIGPESRIRPKMPEFLHEVKEAAKQVSANIAKTF
ncbi:MAG TPA: IclR family transcriptional regulator C-terminal domain-containing protein [Dehalococcoidales bacterium]|nr:IclR family transcriptional regulator C-terminal domain-containing protein [Dehalococcoidales bacterium]